MKYKVINLRNFAKAQAKEIYKHFKKQLKAYKNRETNYEPSSILQFWLMGGLYRLDLYLFDEDNFGFFIMAGESELIIKRTYNNRHYSRKFIESRLYDCLRSHLIELKKLFNEIDLGEV